MGQPDDIEALIGSEKMMTTVVVQPPMPKSGCNCGRFCCYLIAFIVTCAIVLAFAIILTGGKDSPIVRFFQPPSFEERVIDEVGSVAKSAVIGFKSPRIYDFSRFH